MMHHFEGDESKLQFYLTYIVLDAMLYTEPLVKMLKMAASSLETALLASKH